MLQRILVVKITPISSFTVLCSLSNSVLSPQITLPRFRFFLILIHYFLRTSFGPREWLAVCGLLYLVYLFFSYLSHALLDFSKTSTTFYLMHTLQVQQFSELSCHLILFQSILYTAE